MRGNKKKMLKTVVFGDETYKKAKNLLKLSISFFCMEHKNVKRLNLSLIHI